jgi:hypothetical protein
MVIWKRESEKGAGRITFYTVSSRTESSTRKSTTAGPQWDTAKRSSDEKEGFKPNVPHLKGAGYQGFRAGWHATLCVNSVGLRSGCDMVWGARQACSLPSIHPIQPYPRKVKLYPVTQWNSHSRSCVCIPWTQAEGFVGYEWSDNLVV